MEAFKWALGKHGMSFHENYFSEAESYGFNGGYNATKKILENSEAAPDFVFAFSDELAIGVIKCLENNGLRVPIDVSVIGFDDIYFAKHLTPALSTIYQDKQAIGEAAAKKLLDIIEGKKENIVKVEKIPVSLIIRESTI